MYQSSEEAMDANEAISFEAARRELARHGMQCRVPMSAAHAGDIFVLSEFGDGSSEWETIPCTTKAILEWLGY